MGNRRRPLGAGVDELQPGQSQTLTLSYDTTQMASYDTAKSAYVLDAGNYYVRVGDCSAIIVGSKPRPADRRRHGTVTTSWPTSC